MIIRNIYEHSCKNKNIGNKGSLNFQHSTFNYSHFLAKKSSFSFYYSENNGNFAEL